MPGMPPLAEGTREPAGAGTMMSKDKMLVKKILNI